MKKSTKKALSLLLAAVMVFGLIMPYSVSAFASGAVINVTSEQELKQALNKDSEVSNINIVQNFTVNSECAILFDSAHLNNYHDTVLTIAEGVTLTVGNGGIIGSMWPSYEGDRETPPLPNGKVINNGTVIVEKGGATEADFDTNNGDILVKDGGSAVCCNTNNGTVVVEDGGQYVTSQGGTATNKGNIVIHQGAMMESRFGSKIVNAAGGSIELNGQFRCGCIGDGRDDGFWFDNQGAVSGNGDIILYEADHDIMPVNDMDALIVKMMGFLGKSKRFENWDDINIFKLLEVSDFASLKAALPENRVVAGERVEGNMDTLITLSGNIEIPSGESIKTMARLTLPEGFAVTVNDGAVLECGMDNNGTINVLSGGNFFTTQGGNINNRGVLRVSEGATIKSQMGGEILNFPEATLTLDGVCRVGCIGFGEHDAYWFNSFGSINGNGVIVLYEAAPDEMPVSDLNALANEITASIGVGDGVPAVRTEPAHRHDYKAVVTAPKANAVGFTQYKCDCGEFKKDEAGNVIKDTFTAPTGKPSGLKCAARTAQAMKFTWNKTSGATGYQVQILNSKGGNAGLKALAGNSYTFTKLAAGHAYKARVRFYIKAADGKNYFGQWITINSPTLPAGTSITKVTGAKKAFTAQWKKGAVTGYQLQYATNAKFSKANTKTVKGAAKVKLAVKSLKGGARYYVRVRTFKTIAGKNYYSAWSGAKAVKTK